ncbi:tyrocidine synthase 2 [Arthrobacter sp. Hiyo6]|nr:tyrocidine synthase 2 [Arthrobacter sp. Hiyo6]
MVVGRSCPDDLVRRWHRAGRRFLNVYGPTEATVTATWTALDPERPVTLGVPLPSYSAVILDPLQAKALPPGEMGEIGLAGIGLARGYVNRQDLTERAFVPDFLGLPNNPRGRIYRTGDLGRINKEGEIEYHGRIDTQVKIRGYRIELAEIESVLLQVPGVAQAVVNTFEPVAGLVELVAYYSLRTDAGEMDPGVIRDWLRERLPGYMVPAYLERLDVVPMLPSGKADRKSLQPPSGDRAATSAQEYAAPANEMEQIIATELGEAIGMKSVSAEANFFNDLGANSLLLAHFCARVRKRGDLPSIAMQDVYLQPTVRSLAAVLADRAAEAGVEEAGEGQSSPAVSVEPAARARTGQYVLCGLLQAVVLVGYAYLDALAIISGYGWVAKGDGLLEIYVRAMVLGGSVFLGMCLVPLLAKWLLIGRWKRQQIPIWSLAYFRFWTVRMLLRFSRWRCSPVRRSTLCTSGRWGPRSDATWPSFPGQRPSARTSSPSATERSFARTPFTPATGRKEALSRPAESPSAGTPLSGRQRSSTSRPPWATAPSWDTPPASSPRRPYRTASTGTERRRNPQQRTT